MNELQNVFNYGDIEVRTVVEGEVVLFVARDVTSILGLDRTATRKLDTDERHVRLMHTPSGLQEMTMINESGLYNLIFSSRKDEAKKFKKWVTSEVLPSIRKNGHYVGEKKKYLLEVAQEEIGIAELLTSKVGIEKGIAFAVALDRSEKRTGKSLSEYKRLLPPAEHETGHLNATALGKKIGISAIKTNTLLKEIGLQYKEEYKKGKTQWRLTEVGKEYGEELPYTRNGHSGYQIMWNDDVLDIIKEQPTAK